MSLPLGTLVTKAPSAGEVGALVSRVASPQVLVHGHTWGYSHVSPCPLMLGGHSGPKAGVATGQARQSTLLADQGTGGWKHRWPGPAAPAGPWLPTHTRLHTSGPSGMGTFHGKQRCWRQSPGSGHQPAGWLSRNNSRAGTQGLLRSCRLPGLRSAWVM